MSCDYCRKGTKLPCLACGADQAAEDTASEQTCIIKKGDVLCGDCDRMRAEKAEAELAEAKRLLKICQLEGRSGGWIHGSPMDVENETFLNKLTR